MPVTVLSHQALVLPLKMRWPRRFSGLALCIGSMAPDLEFIATLRDDWIVSHTLSAQFWFTVPVTMIAVWIVCALVLPVILPFVRDHPTWRLHDLAAIEIPRGWRGWTSVALSAWVGGVSHVVLDGFTHGNQLRLARAMVSRVANAGATSWRLGATARCLAALADGAAGVGKRCDVAMDRARPLALALETARRAVPATYAARRRCTTHHDLPAGGWLRSAYGACRPRRRERQAGGGGHRLWRGGLRRRSRGALSHLAPSSRPAANAWSIITDLNDG